jgi:hypothetical protein
VKKVRRGIVMGSDLVRRATNRQGMISVVVALLIIIMIGAAALAIDIGHLSLVRNELQNAADAGCLAAARFLYDEDGTVNEGVNQIAYEAAIANKSDKSPVEVHWSGGNEGDVERGHWSFGTKTFTPNPSTQSANLVGMSGEDLDNDPNFVNAVRVRTRRQDTPAASFFARVFGHENFFLSTEAIAYLGFAGTLAPQEVDQPIAVCREAILTDEKYTCTIGRRITLGWESEREIGGWTDFNQDEPCTTGTNAHTVTSLVCNGGNPNPIFVRQPVASNDHDISFAFTRLRQCWESATGRTRPWTLTVPVISCPDYQMGNCQSVVGAVTIHVVWMTGENYDPFFNDVPWTMENPNTGATWSSSHPDGSVRWMSFVQNFNLQRLNGSPVSYREKSIYFLPDCNYYQPKGRTGGENFGVLAKIPVLAK